MLPTRWKFTATFKKCYEKTRRWKKEWLEGEKGEAYAVEKFKCNIRKLFSVQPSSNKAPYVCTHPHRSWINKSLLCWVARSIFHCYGFVMRNCAKDQANNFMNISEHIMMMISSVRDMREGCDMKFTFEWNAIKRKKSEELFQYIVNQIDIRKRFNEFLLIFGMKDYLEVYLFWEILEVDQYNTKKLIKNQLSSSIG